MVTAQPFTLEQVEIDLLRPDPLNPRRIADSMLGALSATVRDHGVVQPVVVRRADMTIIAGHQRLVAARRCGMTTISAYLLDLPPDKARLLGLALNKISGTFDDPLLARLLAELH